MANNILFKRGTRSGLNALAGANSILAGQPYLITDEGRLAVGLTASTFSTFVKQGEGDTTVNALTFNSAGTGAASGSTFNGSAAVTISYNTIGALAAANPASSGTFTHSGTTVWINTNKMLIQHDGTHGYIRTQAASGNLYLGALGNTLVTLNGTTSTVSVSGLLNTAASTATLAGLRIPHGAAPTAPVDGDLWSTTTGFYGRVNGVTVGPFGTGGSGGASTAVNVSFTQTGTGAVASNVQVKLQEIVSVKDFGAVGNGTTNDTPAIQAAIDSLGALGGTVRIPEGMKCLIDTALNVKPNVSLIGPHEFLGSPANNASAPYGSLGGALIINSTVNVNIYGGATVKGLLIYRKGAVFPVTDPAGTFAGTALVAKNDDVNVANCMILGFAQAYYSTGYARATLSDLKIDCTAGVWIDACYDIAYVTRCHCWPFAAIAGTGTLKRSGVAFRFTNGGDWNKVTDCFSYGYQRGFYASSVNSMTFMGCGADNTPAATDPNTGSIGFLVDGTSLDTRFIGCQAAAQDHGFYINSSSTGRHTRMTACDTWGGITNGVYIGTGEVSIMGGIHRNTVNGVNVTVSTSKVTILGVRFESLTNGIVGTNTDTAITQDRNTFVSVTNLVVTPFQFTAPAGDGMIPDGTVTTVYLYNAGPATVGIGTFGNAVAYNNRTLTIVAAASNGGTITLYSGGSFRLMNGNNITLNPNESVTLTGYGSTWLEVGRDQLFNSTSAGYVPPSGGGTTNFLRADGTWAAAGGGASDPLVLTTGKEATATATAGAIKLLARSFAKGSLGIMDSSGDISTMQSSFGRNNISIWDALPGVTTVPVGQGISAPTSVGTPTARSPTTTSAATRTLRLGYVSTATAGTIAGQYWPTAICTAGGASSGLGGFFLIYRFIITDAATVANARMFAGLSATVAAPTNVDPAGLLNSVGVGQVAGSSNLCIVRSGSAAQAVIDLTNTFALSALQASQEIIELQLYSSSFSDAINYRVERVSSSIVTSGTLTQATSGVQLPGPNVMLAPRAWRTNNATAAVVGLDIISMYLETDN